MATWSTKPATTSRCRHRHPKSKAISAPPETAHLFEVLADELGIVAGRVERNTIDKFAAFEREANLKIAVSMADLGRKLRDEINQRKVEVRIARCEAAMAHDEDAAVLETAQDVAGIVNAVLTAKCHDARRSAAGLITCAQVLIDNDDLIGRIMLATIMAEFLSGLAREQLLEVDPHLANIKWRH